MTQVDTPASLPGAGASQDEHLAALSGYKYGWHDSDAYAAASRRGLSEDVAVSYTHLTLPTTPYV